MLNSGDRPNNVFVLKSIKGYEMISDDDAKYTDLIY